MKNLNLKKILIVIIHFIIGTQLLIAQGTWTMQNPKLDITVMGSVFFIDSLKGWSCGEDFIFVTEDGGITWTEQNSGTSNYLKSVYFTDPLIGWCVGSSGTILHTTDDGETWGTQISGTSVELKAVFFADSENGWICGREGTLLRTDDGGSTWNPQTSGTDVDLYSICFVDSETGWAVGTDGMILNTIDGGSNWDSQISGTTSSLFSVCFVDSLRGFIAKWGEILKTTDGGVNWEIISTGKSHSYQSVFFTDSLTGWLVGDFMMEGVIMKTTDGGTEWTQVEVSTELNAVHFSNSLKGWAVGGRGFTGAIFKTTDGGLTWQNQCFATNETLFCTHFLDSKLGWAGGKKGTLVKTTDAGLTWKKVQTASEWRTYYEIYFSDSQTGWACSSYGKVHKTTNGGNTWIEKSTSTDKAFHDMHFINSKLGWVVGGGSVSGEIFKTSDGGNSWTEQDSPAEKCLFGLYFIDSLVGWCTGMDGTILKTSNGGEDWELKNNGVPEGQWLEDIYFYDSLKGFAVGEGIILYSVDGGETWSEKENVSGWADKICFIDENNGWILGTEAGVGKGIDGSGNIDLYGSSEAKIWKTSNGGDDWEEEVLPLGRWILDAYFADQNSGWTAGSSGHILHYSNTLAIPLPPGNLTATSIENNQIVLSWEDYSSNEDGFYIYRSDSLSGDYKYITSVTSNSTSYTDSEVINGITYWYFIRAYNTPGISAKTLDAYAITGEPAPISDFSANITNGDMHLTVNFTDLSTGSVSSWSWAFGDGGTSTEQNPIHTYTSAGTYTVSLTVTGAGGNDTEIRTDYITVTVPAPIADFSVDLTSGEAPLVVGFTDISTGDISSWLWDFGDTGTSTEQNPSHTYAEEGTYTVSLTVTGAGGSDTEIKTAYIVVTTPTVVLNLKTDNNTVIFPNPAMATCTVSLPYEISGNVNIKIFNTNGVVVISKTYIEDKIYNIDLSELSAGLYYISISSEMNTLTNKLIISK